MHNLSGNPMISGACLAVLLVSAGMPAFCQKPAPSFEVASIRLNEGGRGEGIENTPGGLSIRNTRLSSCIAWAYSVQDYQVSGPPWLSDLRFDIVAKAAGTAPEAEVRR